MQTWTSWFLSEIPSFLWSEPIKYLWGLILLAYTFKIIISLRNFQEVKNLANIISSVTLLVTESVSWITSAVGAVMQTGNELLMFFVLVGFVSIGFGLLRRFFAQEAEL